jgi:hypothetical protein
VVGYPGLVVRRYDHDDRSGRFALHLDRAVGGIEEVYPNRPEGSFVSWPSFLTNASAPSGMSGGPVIDIKGEVIGVLSWGSARPMENYASWSYCSLIATFFNGICSGLSDSGHEGIALEQVA